MSTASVHRSSTSHELSSVRHSTVHIHPAPVFCGVPKTLRLFEGFSQVHPLIMNVNKMIQDGNFEVKLKRACRHGGFDNHEIQWFLQLNKPKDGICPAQKVVQCPLTFGNPFATNQLCLLQMQARCGKVQTHHLNWLWNYESSGSMTQVVCLATHLTKFDQKTVRKVVL